jgi:hypothetical protein
MVKATGTTASRQFGHYDNMWLVGKWHHLPQMQQQQILSNTPDVSRSLLLATRSCSQLYNCNEISLHAFTLYVLAANQAVPPCCSIKESIMSSSSMW